MHTKTKLKAKEYARKAMLADGGRGWRNPRPRHILGGFMRCWTSPANRAAFVERWGEKSTAEIEREIIAEAEAGDDWLEVSN